VSFLDLLKISKNVMYYYKCIAPESLCAVFQVIAYAHIGAAILSIYGALRVCLSDPLKFVFCINNVLS